MTRTWTRRRIGALTIGLVATLVGAIVYSLGWLDRLNGFNLDLHFRHFNAIEADPRIVLIDIDDSTLNVMPDWPWPRRIFADLVRTLDEFEPQTIVLDIVFDQPSRSITSVSNDGVLAAALQEAGNVFVAMFADIKPPSASRSTQCEDYRVAAHLFLRENPTATWEEYLRAAMPGKAIDIVTPERESLLSGFRQARSQQFIDSRLASVANSTQDVYPTTSSLTMPLDMFAQTARGVGMVSFRRIRQSEIIRSLPLVVDAEDVLLPQLGVLVALDHLGVSPDQILQDGHRWLFGRGEYRRIVQIDGNGTSLVTWHAPRGEDWRYSFLHLPAALVLELSENRRAIEENGARLAMAFDELVHDRHADTPAAYNDYARLVNQRIEFMRTAPPVSDGSTPVDPAIGKVESESVEWLRRAWSLWEHETPRTAEETAQRDSIKRFYDRFGEGQYAVLLNAANKGLEARNVQLIGELAPRLKGKICLVGYTATAMADMVPTPVDPAMPGVMVHANVINMFLQNRFASEASRGVDLAIIILAGFVTTLTSCARGTRFSLLSLFVFAAGILLIGAALFWSITYHIAAFVVVTVILLVWASVTVYRQATEERARRTFQRALAQYTSPAVATRIADRTKADDLAPQKAVVTCFFSDLADFTRLSERLGPQQTRQILNPYLRGVSAALLDHGAMVNKFIGDGIFAFFNAPILPCPNHAHAACAGALASLAAVAESNARRQPNDSDDSLAVRIGLSTGEAFVGDYGSDMKLDYTCIGDTVNLGSRLERANKTFGTAILVDDATRQAAGDGFIFRSLGLVEVAGRAASVAVHELVGKASSTDEPTRQYIAMFEQAISDFQHCRWDSCLANLAECRKRRTLDRAIAVYQAAVARHRAAPPTSSWTGAIPIGVH